MMERPWFKLSLGSFYGVFGHMNVRNPYWVYGLVGLGAALLVCATVLGMVFRWSSLPSALRISLGLSPLIVVLNLWASAVHSLHLDFQPQGRYLFASLIPVALLLTGTIPFDSRRLRAGRTWIFGVLYAVCVSTLVATVLLNPALSRF